jgi:hypothetical protein
LFNPAARNVSAVEFGTSETLGTFGTKKSMKEHHA